MASERRLPEDVVEYFIMPKIPENLSDTELDNFLKQQQDLYLAHLSHFLVDYIWQKDPFALSPSTTQNVPCLQGSANFGENIEDEWFIVYILMELTASFPGATARVVDNDGEFLLIEAANVLPKWLNPDSGENRVYIHNGDIHIIPLPSNEQTFLPLFTPTAHEAIDCISNHGNVTRATDQIQKCIKKRLERYPKCITENTHHTNCYLPASLAAILTHTPSIVAAGVQAFYYRDPIDLKSCRTMKYFRPGTRVLHRVKFTRCLYSQLMGQRFQPDRRSGWVMPNATHKDFRAHDLGMKLAHGFEILCAQSSTNQNGCSDTHHPTDNGSDVRWNKFVQSLQENGYFRGQLEGSQLYKSLLQDARRFYETSVNDNQNCQSSLGAQILSLLNSVPHDMEAMRKAEATLPPSDEAVWPVSYDMEAMRKAEAILPPSDDDSWMNIKQEDLDRILSERSGVPLTEPDNKQLAESMKAFVETVSSHEGAEFPGDMDDGVEGQPDGLGFIHSMQKMFDFKDDDGDSASSSDMDEYDWTSDDERQRHKPTSHLPPPKASVNKPSNRPSASSTNTQNNKQNNKQSTSQKNNQSTSHKNNQTGEKSSKQNDTRTVEDFMDMMDRELANTNIGKSFEKKPVAPPRRKRANNPADRDINHEDDGFRPVDVDMNTVKNMLKSYSSQQGMAGPAGNLLGGMGLKFGEGNKGDDLF